MSRSGTLLLAASGAPVAPDATEAQRWAEEELSKPIYDQQPGLIARLLEWLGQLWDQLSGAGVSAPPSFVPVIVVAAFVLVVVLALLLGGRVQRRRKAERGASHQLFEDSRDSAALRAAADEAARRGDWVTAVLERFRALIRSLDERTVLEDRAGLTAHEAATLAGAALPEHADELRWAGRLFDDVCYGHLAPGPEQDERLRTLAGAIARARPRPPEERELAGAGWTGVR